VPPLGVIRERPPYLRGNALVLTITRTLGNFGRRMTYPFAALYVLVLGGDPAQVGIVSALMALAGLVLLPISGHIVDHAGRVKLSYRTQLACGVAYLVFVLAPRWEVIAVASVLLGVNTLQSPADSALMADSVPPEMRGKGFAIMNALIGLPAMLAPYVGGLVVEAAGTETGLRCLYGYLMLAALVGGVIKWRYLCETATATGPGVRWADLGRIVWRTYRGFPELYRGASPSLRALGAVCVLVVLGNAIAGPFWVVYAVEQIGLSSERWGLILLIEAGCLNLAYLPAGTIADRWGRTRCQRLGLVLALVSAGAFVLARGFALVLVSRFSVALSQALFMPANAALVADTVPRNVRGRMMAAIGRGSALIHSPGGGLGGPPLGYLAIVPVIVCSLIAGYFYTIDPTVPWIVLSAVFALALALSLRFIRDPVTAEA